MISEWQKAHKNGDAGQFDAKTQPRQMETFDVHPGVFVVRDFLTEQEATVSYAELESSDWMQMVRYIVHPILTRCFFRSGSGGVPVYLFVSH